MIDTTQLPELDTTQTVGEVMRRYRFLNTQNIPLAPFMPEDRDDFYQRPLQQVLHQDRWFELQGRVQAIEYLKVSGEPINKRWVTTFPALP